MNTADQAYRKLNDTKPPKPPVSEVFFLGQKDHERPMVDQAFIHSIQTASQAMTKVLVDWEMIKRSQAVEPNWARTYEEESLLYNFALVNWLFTQRFLQDHNDAEKVKYIRAHLRYMEGQVRQHFGVKVSILTKK